MGFYAPAQIVRDARQHGVEIRPIDVNSSRWDCTLEASNGCYKAIRLGLCMIRDLSNADGAAIAAARDDQPYTSVEEIQRRAGVGRSALDRIGDADGFGSLALSRRAALWGVKGLGNDALPLFAAAGGLAGKLLAEAHEPEVVLPSMTEGSDVVEDYRASGLSLRAHPLAFLRDELRARKMITCEQMPTVKDGRWIKLAGIVLVRQKPGSAKGGVMFVTLEDETNVANLVVWTKVFEANRRIVLGASMMGCAVRSSARARSSTSSRSGWRICHRCSPRSETERTSDVYRTIRADVVKSPFSPDPRAPANRTLGRAAREIYIPDLRLGSGIIPGEPTEGIKIKPRDFR